MKNHHRITQIMVLYICFGFCLFEKMSTYLFEVHLFTHPCSNCFIFRSDCEMK